MGRVGQFPNAKEGMLTKGGGLDAEQAEGVAVHQTSYKELSVQGEVLILLAR